MKSLIKVILSIALVGSLITSCNNNEKKTGWEPETASPLVLFSIDLNQYIDFASFTDYYFGQISTQSEQNQLLYNTISTSLADSVKQRLPHNLQVSVDSFMYDVAHHITMPDYTANSLLLSLFDAFKTNGSISTIDLFAYSILSGLPSTLNQQAKDSLYHITLNINQNIGINIDWLRQKSTNVLWLKTLLAANTRLTLSANYQVFLLNGSPYQNVMLSGSEGIIKPSPDGYTQRIVTDYSDSTKMQVLNIQSVTLTMASDSLCLNLEHVKDLTQRKFEVTVGVMFKVNLDDELKKY